MWKPCGTIKTMVFLAPAIGLVGISFILAMAEFVRAAKLLKQPELLRKFVHILVAVFVATWPFFMPVETIMWLSGLLFLVVLISKQAALFDSVHKVDRTTYGELLYPVAIFISAAWSGSDWIFAASLLHLGLADGLAAVIGIQNLGHMNYKIFGHTKSLIGTMVFYMVSVTVTVATVLWLDPDSFGSLSVAVVLWIPITAALVENFAVFGTDNLLVPMVVIAGLNTAQIAI